MFLVGDVVTGYSFTVGACRGMIAGFPVRRFTGIEIAESAASDYRPVCDRLQTQFPRHRRIVVPVDVSNESSASLRPEPSRLTGVSGSNSESVVTMQQGFDAVGSRQNRLHRKTEISPSGGPPPHADGRDSRGRLYYETMERTFSIGVYPVLTVTMLDLAADELIELLNA